MTLPIAVTMGDPAGVGPELIAKLVHERPDAKLAVFGDARLFEGQFDFELASELSDKPKAKITLVDIPCAETPKAGQPSLRNAQAVVGSIESAVAAVQSHHCAALLTAPINKANVVNGAAFQYPGHTEFLAALDGEHAKPVMLLRADNILSVVPLTIHIPLQDVAKTLSPALIKETITIVHHDLKKYLKTAPKIAVAGLNPHAGENGLMGHEENNIIKPAIKALMEEGIEVSGPYSADTLFHERARAQYDVAICMYHDQALIPIKTLAFDVGVNVTLGLSFLRTSPDHGTAYDIAGRGIANPSSLIAAYDLALGWSV